MLTWYGLDGPEMESRFGARFSAAVQTGPGAHTASYSMDTGSFPGVKRPGRVVDHPPPSSAEVEERVELYLYSRPEPSWAVVIGRIFPFSCKISRLCLSNISRYTCNVHGCHLLQQQQKFPTQCVFGFAWFQATEQCKWVLRSSGMFRGVDWCLPTFRDSQSVPSSRLGSPRPVC